jgi:hypothetical protein
MELKKGIMLLNESNEAYSNITINGGVLPYTEQKKTKVKYGRHSFYPLFEDKAYLPKRNWRPLTAKEITPLRPAARRTDTNTVYTGNPPETYRIAATTGPERV